MVERRIVRRDRQGRTGDGWGKQENDQESNWRRSGNNDAKSDDVCTIKAGRVLYLQYTKRQSGSGSSEAFNF